MSDNQSPFGQNPAGQNPAGNQPNPDPYAQAQAAGAPGQPAPGQPAPGQVPGQPGGQWYTDGGAAPAPKKKSMGRQVLSLVLLVALIIGMKIGFDQFNKAQATKGLEVGGCITVTKKLTKIEHEKADCTGGEAVSFTIVEELKTGDCTDPYTGYTFEDDGKTYATYCLMPNLDVDKCYAEESNGPLVAVDCADPDALLKVTKRVENNIDPAQCESGSALAYPKAPARLYCAEAAS